MKYIEETSLDSLGKTILSDIQRFPGFERTIVAGGYCRDIMLGGVFKDVDLWVPEMPIDKFRNMIDTLPSDWKYVGGNFTEVRRTSSYKIVERVKSINNFKYLGEIDVQIMVTRYEPEMFPIKTVEDFSFGIDQIWSEGDDLKYTNAFRDDYMFNRATLTADIESFMELPQHMRKYERLVKKYPMLSFFCKNNLKISPVDKKTDTGTGIFKTKEAYNSWLDALSNAYAPPTAPATTVIEVQS